jgi:hypothetical protein
MFITESYIYYLYLHTDMPETDTSIDKDKYYRDSLGEYVCSVCNVPHRTRDLAISCWGSHQSSSDSSSGSVLVSPDNKSILSSYSSSFKRNDLVSASKSLVLSMLEDYYMVRSNDITKVGRPGPLTLNFSKAASETMLSLLKVVHGERSMGVNVNIGSNGKPDDISALRDFIRGTGNSSLDSDKASDWVEGDPVPYNKKFTNEVKRNAIE